MTRFKELQRIEAAIKHKDKDELGWALVYCKMRLGIAPRKDHQKHWRKLESNVQRALAEAQSSTEWLRVPCALCGERF